jgi:hypothetical protein
VRCQGLTVDVPVRSLAEAGPFYELCLDRPADLMPRPGILEWILHEPPQIALRLVEDPERAGSARVGFGVVDVNVERGRLTRELRGLPEVRAIPGVIALLELRDGDGNGLTLWQDLMLDRASGSDGRA